MFVYVYNSVVFSVFTMLYTGLLLNLLETKNQFVHRSIESLVGVLDSKEEGTLVFILKKPTPFLGRDEMQQGKPSPHNGLSETARKMISMEKQASQIGFFPSDEQIQKILVFIDFKKNQAMSKKTG